MRLIPKSLVQVLSALFTRQRRQSSEPSPTADPQPLSWSEILNAMDERERETYAGRSFGKRKVRALAALAAPYGRSPVEDFNKAADKANATRSAIAESLAQKRWRPANKEAERHAEQYNTPEEKTIRVAVPEKALPAALANQAAAHTLSRLGWSWRGGVEWRPPMGPMPDFDLLDKLKSEYEERVVVLDSKRQDLEARLKVAEARADVREASCLETARHLGEIEGWKRRAREYEGHAEGASKFIAWLRDVYSTLDANRRKNLADIIDAWLDHEEKILSLVEAWADEREGETAAQVREWNSAFDYATTLAREGGSPAGWYWLQNWVDGHPAVTAELKKWMAENDRGGKTGAQPELQGAAVVGRNGLPDVPVAVGYERSGATPMQPARDSGTGLRTGADANSAHAKPEPRTADMAAVSEAMRRADASKHLRCIVCMTSDKCRFPANCAYDH